MPHKHLTSLGISPGTRRLGIGIIRDGDLRDWRNIGFHGRWSARKLDRIRNTITSLLERTRPDVVSLKTPHPSRSSDHLDRIVTMITELAKSRRIRLRRYSIIDVKRTLAPDATINKRRMGDLLATQYPALHPELTAELKNLNPYYDRVFEAIGVATLGYREFERRSSESQ